MAEATNELAFLVTGAYGKPIAKQHGAPMRLAVPWKYGFKSIKSIVRVHVHRQAAEELLGGPAGVRIRLLGQRQSGGAASALEPGDRGSDRHRRAPADAVVQRLRRVRRRALQGPRRQGAAVGVTAPSRAARFSLTTNKSRALAGPAQSCRRGTADNHLPEGNKLPASGWLIWGDATTQRRQHNEIMRRARCADNAKRRMPAMRRGKNRCSMPAMQCAQVNDRQRFDSCETRSCSRDQKLQRCALLTRKSRNACTRATDLSSSG